MESSKSSPTRRTACSSPSRKRALCEREIPSIPASVFSHVVVGAALASAAPSGVVRARLALVLAAAAAMPDLDVIGFSFGVSYGDPLGHRGLSHSLLFAALVAPLLARLAGVGPRDSRFYARVCFLAFVAVASHGLLDAATDAGLGVGFFIPFSSERYFLPWRPILTSPLGVGAFFSPRGLAILANEFAWIMAPTLACAALVLVARRSR
jgi:inner membrane protein